MDNWQDLIGELTQVEALKVARDEAIDDWGTDIPTTVLFGCIGRNIAKQFDTYLPDERVYIFNIIELAMNKGDTDLKTFVATGLLEALYSQASRDVILWERINNVLGRASKKYLAEWEAWGT